nr:hypothetical protein [Miltoncostaea marina]
MSRIAQRTRGRLRLGDGVVTEDDDPPRRRAHEAGGHPDERALAGAVRAQQAVEGPGRDAQVDPPQRDRPVVVDLLEPDDLEGRQGISPHRPPGKPCPGSLRAMDHTRSWDPLDGFADEPASSGTMGADDAEECLR